MKPIYNLIAYVFDPLPPSAFSYLILVVILAAVLLVGSLFLRFYIRKNKENKTFKRLFRQYPPKLETMAVLLVIYLLSRHYTVAFLSTRILLYLLLGVTAYFLYRMFRTYSQEYPLEKKRHHEQLEKNKYLPRKNHK